MHTLHPYSFFHLGDAALTIDFGNVIDDGINNKVLQLFHHLKNSSISYIVDLVPAYSSLTVYYDVVRLRKKNAEQTAFDSMADIIRTATQNFSADLQQTSRTVEVPVCYAKKFALDMDKIASQKKLSEEEIILIHTSKTYRVYMLGFLPGFPYMAELDERIATPRRTEPRTTIAAGSVGIAGRQTGIYPLDSPGGWQIVGKTPLKLFDAAKENPVMFEPGDEVKFYSITEDEFAHYQSRHT